MKKFLFDIERRTEILAIILESKSFSKAELADAFTVAEITISRDLRWLRENGIAAFSKKGKVILLEKSKRETKNKILSEYLSVKLNSSFFYEKIVPLSKTHNQCYFQNLVTLSKAVSEKKIIKTEYKRLQDNNIFEYDLMPLKIVQTGLNWILHAVKMKENLLKTFYVTRFSKIKLINENFVLPEQLEQAADKEEIVLKFLPELKSQLIDKIWFEEFEINEEKDGSIILKTYQPITNKLASWCISWWDGIEIISPDYLKEFIFNMYSRYNEKNMIKKETKKLEK